jgi:hypothetical protein
MAKPLNYTKEQKKELFTKICNDVIENKTSFNQAILNNKITLTTFYSWLIDDDSLKELYNYAREIRSDTLFEEIIVIADTTEEGIKIKETAKGTEILKGDMTDHRKLRVDARKWVVSKMNPKKYGDKVEIDHSSKDGSMSPNLSNLSNEELEKRLNLVSKLETK